MKNTYKYNVSLCLLLLFSAISIGQTFQTKGNGIRGSVAATVNEKSVLYVSEINGALASYSTSGQLIWQRPTQSAAVMFEIDAADINGDGNDDLLAASGDGHIYLWSSKGELLWKFAPKNKVRFSEVAVTKNKGEIKIFAGGNDRMLYELNKEGKLVSTTELNGVVRTLAAGNFLDKDAQSLFVVTYNKDKWSWNFLGIIDPEDKKAVRTMQNDHSLLKTFKAAMINDVDISDLDNDGKDDILLFGSAKVERPMAGIFAGLNGELEIIAKYMFPEQDKQSYAHAFGTSLQPVRNEVAMIFGTVMYVTDLKGKLIGRTGDKYKNIAFNGVTLMSDSKELLGNGQIGGGNTFYAYDLTRDKWWETEHRLKGRMKEVEQNLYLLYQQALNYEMPEYQKKPKQPWVMIAKDVNNKVKQLKGADLMMIDLFTMSENTDRSHLVEAIGKDALKRDQRKKYKQTREELLQIVREYEKSNRPFVIWAGHGTDPFYIHVETIEEILKIAKNTCYGFVYAEMENSKDPRFHYFVDHYIPRMAKAMREQGKAKLFFRYKGVFWAASAHTDPWKKLFFSGKYRDLIVPSTEDTNSRTQELNLAGRVGMLVGGFADNFAIRTVTDNVTSWRPLSSSGQTSISPFLRSAVMRAAYGAKYGLIANIPFVEEPGNNILYALMASGVLPQVNPEDILSIGAWHLLRDIDTEHVHHLSLGHEMITYKINDDEGVYSVANVSWAGASVPSHDFSKALGVDYRWLNFVPELPNGMIPIGPASLAPSLKNNGIPFTVSNTHTGYIDGEKCSAREFGKHIETSAEDGAKQMLLRVSGAAWSAIKLDKNHVRLILIDQGYIDPQERTATVKFQGMKPHAAHDILSKESIPISGHEISVKVPAGSMRFIDIEYSGKIE